MSIEQGSTGEGNWGRDLSFPIIPSCRGPTRVGQTMLQIPINVAIYRLLDNSDMFQAN